MAKHAPSKKKGKNVLEKRRLKQARRDAAAATRKRKDAIQTAANR